VVLGACGGRWQQPRVLRIGELVVETLSQLGHSTCGDLLRPFTSTLRAWVSSAERTLTTKQGPSIAPV